MKSILIVCLLVSSICFGQKKDSVIHKVDSSRIRQQQIQAEVEALNFVISDMKTVLFKLPEMNSQAYESFLKIIDLYIKEKEKQYSPKKK